LSIFRRYWYELVLSPLTLLVDVAGVSAAYAASYWLRSLEPNSLQPQVYVGLAVSSCLIVVFIFAFFGLYQKKRRESRFDEAVFVLLGVGISLGVLLAGVFFIRSISISRLVLLYTFGITAFLLVSARLGLQGFDEWMRNRGFGLKRLLILGTSLSAQTLGERLERNLSLGYEVVGYLTDSKEDLSKHKVLGTVDELATHLTLADPIDEVWLALPEKPGQEVAHLIATIKSQTSVDIKILPDVLEFFTLRLDVDSLGGMTMLTLRDTSLRKASNRVLKRTLDLILSSLALIIFSPFMLVIALGVKLTSPGPVFYKQERVSRDGDAFGIYKFRSMYIDSEAAGPGWTSPEDQRVTPLGRIIRKTSLDELPQLVNVFLGEMSLVGPRPERPHYVEQFSQDIPKYLDRHLVKTGITGWAQIHGLRGDTSIPERVRYDLYYIENWSLLLDLRILMVTIWQLFRGQYNAY
jgi:putative colanic acid biosysnthesis UDP-glucose lipid carrier transferase